MRMVTSNQVLHFWWDWRELRGHIIEELYVLLRRLGINSKLIVTGLALLQDPLKIHQEMLEGVPSFRKAAADQLRSDLRWNQKPGQEKTRMTGASLFLRISNTDLACPGEPPWR